MNHLEHHIYTKYYLLKQYIMTHCKKGTRKCVNSRCYRKTRLHHFSKKNIEMW